MRPLRTPGAVLASLLAAATAAACAPTVTGGEFARHEAAMQAEGLLRFERAPADVPFGKADLVDHFERVVFLRNPEEDFGRTRVDRLQRWEEPVRWRLSAAGPQALAATRDVETTFARLAAATGLDIARVQGPREANFSVLILGSEDYGPAAAWVRSAFGEEAAEFVRAFRTEWWPCAFYGLSRTSPEGELPPGSIFRALVMIRQGFSDAYRLGCVEEELAQALGAANDDDAVRPSVFNDDEEFALLTVHDELLLRILYDPRLRAGMPAEEVMPVVHRIVEDMRPGQ